MNIVVPFRTESFASPLETRFAEVENRMVAAHETHLGYPYNLIAISGPPQVPEALGNYLINNLGDPYSKTHYGSEVCDLEREAVTWLMDLWECNSKEEYWGTIGASGTEGNLWALYLAREALPQAKLIYSGDAHYSIPKAAKILRMDSICVDSDASGAINLAKFAATLDQLRGQTVIIALTCGTTVKGAHDDIDGVMGLLANAGFAREQYYVHLDGALNAMVLPFADDVPSAIKPSFRHGIDSISTSGHKMIGTPMPCGVLIAKRQHVDRISSAIAYLRSNDTTLMGSRNGHSVVSIWSRLYGHGAKGYREDVKRCLALADDMCKRLEAVNVPVLRNPHSLTVVFPQPSEEIIKTYQLACNNGEAHAIVMPSVTAALLDRFVGEYVEWWKSVTNSSSKKQVKS